MITYKLDGLANPRNCISNNLTIPPSGSDSSGTTCIINPNRIACGGSDFCAEGIPNYFELTVEGIVARTDYSCSQFTSLNRTYSLSLDESSSDFTQDDRTTAVYFGGSFHSGGCVTTTCSNYSPGEINPQKWLPYLKVQCYPGPSGVGFQYSILFGLVMTTDCDPETFLIDCFTGKAYQKGGLFWSLTGNGGFPCITGFELPLDTVLSNPVFAQDCRYNMGAQLVLGPTPAGTGTYLSTATIAYVDFN